MHLFELCQVLEHPVIGSAILTSSDIDKAIASSMDGKVSLSPWDGPDLTFSFAYNKKILITATGDTAYVVKV